MMIQNIRHVRQLRLSRAREAQIKLGVAFKLLRKQGLIARQRFSCCRSCAGYEIATQVEVSIDKGRAAPQGAVFYCRQEGLVNDAKNDARLLYLSFGPINSTKHGTIGLTTKEVGKMVAKTLRDVGLAVEWNGSENKSIVVDPCPELWS